MDTWLTLALKSCILAEAFCPLAICTSTFNAKVKVELKIGLDCPGTLIMNVPGRFTFIDCSVISIEAFGSPVKNIWGLLIFLYFSLNPGRKDSITDAGTVVLSSLLLDISKV